MSPGLAGASMNLAVAPHREAIICASARIDVGRPVQTLKISGKMSGEPPAASLSIDAVRCATTSRTWMKSRVCAPSPCSAMLLPEAIRSENSEITPL